MIDKRKFADLVSGHFGKTSQIKNEKNMFSVLIFGYWSLDAVCSCSDSLKQINFRALRNSYQYQ